MFNRQHKKSVLYGMEFGKLEEAAMQSLKKSIDFTTSEGSQADLYAAMATTLSGKRGYVMGWDDLYIPPEPHCMSQVNEIIDKFWANPGEGHMYLYLEQLRKNPITRDLFKSKSTTHHFPWYRRGSKY